MKGNLKKIKGISLISLVVTIIVLIILAGIVISMLLGNEGILHKTGDGRNNYATSANEEALKLADGDVLIDDLSGNGGNRFLPGQTAIDGNEIYFDGTDTAIIPKGFTLSGHPDEYIVANGLVIYDLEGIDHSSWDKAYWIANIATIQSTYNQYVFVPVPGSLARYEGYYNGSKQAVMSTGTEPLNHSTKKALAWETDEYSAMKDSTEGNHCFYIARYEASKGTDNIAESKKGKSVWRNIKWGDSITSAGTTGAVYRAQRVYRNNSDYGVTSTLIFSSQWDALITWLDSTYPQETHNPSSIFINSTGHGNYGSEYGSPGNTGLVAIRNIYDVAGNVAEWTMEACSNSFRVYRGGDYSGAGNTTPISYRDYSNPARTNASVGFRVALYLNP